MKIIAITGHAGSGKDTAAILLQFITQQFSCNGPVDINELVPYHSSLGITSLNRPPVNHIRKFQIAKFAWPVYQIAAILTGHETVEEIMTQKFKETIWNVGLNDYGLTGRQLLQKVGTECFRHILGENVWIGLMARKVGNSKAPGVIISDLRFLNEAAWLLANDATIIRMRGRGGDIGTTHQSESEIDNIKPHYVVHNDRDYMFLAYQLERIARDLKILNCKYEWKTS